MSKWIHIPLLLLIATSIFISNCSSDKPLLTPDGKELNLGRDSGDYRPLYIVDGEFITSSKELDEFLKTVPSYFRNITVLDRDEAIRKYGRIGKYRIVKISLSDTPIPGKTKKKTKKFSKQDVIDYTANEEYMPAILGGMRAVMNKTRYPEGCKEFGAEGRVLVMFTVSKLGHPKNPEIAKGIGFGCDAEALRVIKRTDFLPGISEGKPVEVTFSVPITFKL